MNIKEVLKTLTDYSLLSLKALMTLIATIINQPLILYFNFVVDLINTIYKKIQDENAKDLSLSRLNELNQSSKNLQKNYDKMALDQEAFIKNQEKKIFLKITE